jgi:hypothetical protein
MIKMDDLKREFLELLNKDLEFRYAIAGYLGISEILKRLDTLAEEQVRLREEQVRLREDFNKLREDFNKLREDFNKMFAAFDLRLRRVEGTLQKLTLDVEDEARSIIKYRLKTDFGIEMDLTPLFLPELELNIYGVSDDVCVVGEATVRAGRSVLNMLLDKIELLKAKYPEKLRKRLIPVIYVCLPMPELIEEAAKRKIWVLKATQDFYKPEKA